MDDRFDPRAQRDVALEISAAALELARKADRLGLRELGDRLQAARLQADRDADRDSYGSSSRTLRGAR